MAKAKGISLWYHLGWLHEQHLLARSPCPAPKCPWIPGLGPALDSVLKTALTVHVQSAHPAEMSAAVAAAAGPPGLTLRFALYAAHCAVQVHVAETVLS